MLLRAQHDGVIAWCRLGCPLYQLPATPALLRAKLCCSGSCANADAGGGGVRLSCACGCACVSARAVRPLTLIPAVFWAMAFTTGPKGTQPEVIRAILVPRERITP